MEDTAKRTILVVEDERPLLEAVRVKLEKNNINVLTARSVEQALEYMKDDIRVDGIWLDHYLLGKETGLDFVADIKSNEKFKTIPVFVVSNSSTADKQQTYLRLGAVKFYVKADYRLDDIVEDVKEYVNSSKD